MSSRELRDLVVNRANSRCEYCLAHQEMQPFAKFQVEHILAKQHGGTSSDDNLALACVHCNLRKGPNIAGIDPVTGQIEALFHPRKQLWSDHFEFVHHLIAGITPCGRATVQVLDMNDPVLVELRVRLALQTGTMNQ